MPAVLTPLLLHHKPVMSKKLLHITLKSIITWDMKLLLFFLILSSIFLLLSFNRTSSIPKEWDASLDLVYSTHGQYYEFYNFKNDTLYTEKGFGEKKVTSRVKIKKEQLENLLLTLRNNKADKIKTEDVKYQKHDAASFTLYLKSGDSYLFNLSSSGSKWGKEIRKRDVSRYSSIVEQILIIAKTKP
jgi:hypothetical protein